MDDGVAESSRLSWKAIEMKTARWVAGLWVAVLNLSLVSGAGAADANGVETSFHVVDDFERYQESASQISQTWINGGNAGIPFLERTLFHDGTRSMGICYDNTVTPYHSEAVRTWVAGQDWTSGDVEALVLWSRDSVAPAGTIAAAAEPLCVAVEDTAGIMNMVIMYPDSNAVPDGDWLQWNVDLNKFRAAGVDLGSVKSLTIGIGDGSNPGGKGCVYIDDVRLYPRRCVPGLAKPGWDLNNDCVVNCLDLQIMAANWLSSEESIVMPDSNTPDELQGRTLAAASVNVSQVTSRLVSFATYARMSDTWRQQVVSPLLPSLTVAPTQAEPGVKVRVVGAGFEAGYYSGTLFFDTNRNGQYDANEPSDEITTCPTPPCLAFSGSFILYLTIPPVPVVGNYPIIFQSSSGEEAQVSIKVRHEIVLSPARGSPGTKVMVTGSGFAPNTYGQLFFDINGNNRMDQDPYEAPYLVRTDASGSFVVSDWSVPQGYGIVSCPAGAYLVWFDCPYGDSSPEGIGVFSIAPGITTLCPSEGPSGAAVLVGGAGFDANTSGHVFFDSDGDGVCDNREQEQSVQTGADGSFPLTSLHVPPLAAGTTRYASIYPTVGSWKRRRLSP